jgi:hypothetical protein
MTAPKKPSQTELLLKDHKKHLRADLQTFEELPDDTQEQLLLSDKAARAPGKQLAKVEKKIHTTRHKDKTITLKKIQKICIIHTLFPLPDACDSLAFCYWETDC